VAGKQKPSGSYRVYAYPPRDERARDIMFELAPEAAGASIPKEQGALKNEAERTLHVLRNLFQPEDETRFRGYFNELLGLCQYGLVGVTAQPVQAMDTLKNLQNQIFDNEKGRAISAYMTNTIKAQSLWFGIVLVVIIGCGFAAYRWLDWASYRDHLPLLGILPGLFVGIVFSSFMRCRTITFFDLHAIEADRFTPGLKLAFAISIILIAGAFLKAELFEIKIGKAQLSLFDKDWLSAFVFGAVVGVAQEAIIARIETFRQKFGREVVPRARRN
jgi:hypothetical protein